MRGVIVFAALMVAVLAGAPVLAEEPSAAPEACSQDREPGAVCPARSDETEREREQGQRAEADEAPATPAAGLPIYIPPSRGTATVRVGGSARGGPTGPETL
jgi:hypothetical protein